MNWAGGGSGGLDWCGFRNALSGCRSARCRRYVVDRLLFGDGTPHEVQGPG